MGDHPLTIDKTGPVTRITLTRAEKHNAFDDGLIAALTAAFGQAGADPKCRVIVLAAEGRSFSAGADLAYMQRMAGHDRDANLADARALAELMHTIDRCPKPTVARVQGAAYGGGVGLVACCDIAVAGPRARFCLSEVRLGLIPSVISPFVVAAIGARASRHYFLTADVFNAEIALRLGLVTETVDDEDKLDAAVDAILGRILAAGPKAQEAAKDLIRLVADVDPSDVLEETADRIARIRAGAEGMEGLSAFLEKRKPSFQTVWPLKGEGEWKE